MYYFYMGKVLLPVPPSKMQTVVNNQNKTMNLMNEGEVNILKAPGLTTIKFDIVLPLLTKYPFAMYKDGAFRNAGYFLEYFEKLKAERKVFQFIISRWKYAPMTEKKENVMKTNMTVTLENFAITEDSSEAPDIMVSIELKQYVKYGTITKIIDTTTNTVKKTTQSWKVEKSIPSTYTVKKGDTLWGIAKKLLGDGAKCWNLAKLNNISNPNRIKVGQVLKIQDVKATTAPSGVNSSGSKTSGSTGSNTIKNTRSSLPGISDLDIKILSLTATPKESFDFFKNPSGILGHGRSSGGGGISEKENTHSGGSRSFGTNQTSGTRSVKAVKDFSKVIRSVR